MVEAGADRSERGGEHARDLVVGHILDEAEDEDLAVVQGKTIEGAANVLGVGGGKGVIVGGEGIDQCLINRRNRQPPAAEVAIGTVAGDAIEPRGKRGRILEFGDLAVDVDPGFLQKVVGVGFVGELGEEEMQAGEYCAISSARANSSPVWQRRMRRLS